MKKLIILIAGIVWTWCALAQTSDTISGHHQAEDVLIVARYTVPNSVMNSLKRKQWLGSDVGSFLDYHGLAHQITSGAPGAASSIRFHGMASDHTLITWNGLPINSLSLGMCDMSLLPVFLFDQVVMSDLPDASEELQAGMATTIRLGNGKVDEQLVNVVSDYSSLGNAFIGGQVKRVGRLREGLLSTQVRAFHQSLRNRYKYVDTYHIEKPVRWQDHQQGRFSGVHGDFVYMRGNHSLGLYTWLQRKDMELPGIMGMSASGTAEQQDETMRSMLEYRWRRYRLQTTLRVAYLHERLVYTDEPNFIHSDIQSGTLWSQGNVQWQVIPGREYWLKGMVTHASVRADNSNYGIGRLDKPWTQGALQANIRQRSHDLQLTGSYEQRFGSAGWSSSASYGFHQLIGRNTLVPQVVLSRRYRLPDMNELFWIPGGNPDLQPELAYNARAKVTAKLGENRRTRWLIEPSVFASRVVNWIQWMPTSVNEVWSPVNFRSVQTQGVELHAVADWITSSDQTKFQVETRWTLNDVFWLDSNPSDLRKRMVYAPRIIGYQGLMVEHRRHALTAGYRYVSSRFTDESNTPFRALQAYGLCNLWYRFQLDRNHLLVDINAGVDNLLNVQYETLRSYAMPGRVWRIGLSVTFKQRNTKDTIHTITTD